jgi:hypothetical protein
VGGKVDEPFTLLAGGGGGAAGGGLASLISCGPAAPICALLFVPAGALIGGISAARDAIPESTASEIEAALNRAIADRDLQAELRHGVSRYGGNSDAVIDLGGDAAEPASSPAAYTSIAGSAVGSVLEMSVMQLVLEHKQQFHWGWGDSNPKLALVMTARARMIRVVDQQVLWNPADVKYESPDAQLSLWTGDPNHLDAEIAKGSEVLARQIGEAIFGAPGMARSESR